MSPNVIPDGWGLIDSGSGIPDGDSAAALPEERRTHTVRYIEWEELSAEQFVQTMLNICDGFGYIYVPAFDAEGNFAERSLCCKLTDTPLQGRGSPDDIAAVLTAISSIANKTEHGYLPMPTRAEQAAFEKFLKPFCPGTEEEALEERFRTAEKVRALAQRVADGKILSAPERAFLTGNLGIRVSCREKEKMQLFRERAAKEAEQRVGKGPFSRKVIDRAIFLYRLLCRENAGEHVGKYAKQRARCAFAETYFLNCCCSQWEYVPNEVREAAERDPTFRRSDVFEERKAVRKSIAPVYILQILKDYSSRDKQMNVPQIVRMLKSEYDLPMERKAVTRHLYALADLRSTGVHYLSHHGAWYGEE